MRVIKFRAKTKYDSNYYSAGQWVKGHYHMKTNGCHYITVHEDYDGDIHKPCKSEHIEVDENTLGQFTGQYDVHGQDIYEGDILWQSGSHYLTVIYDKYTGGFKGEAHIDDKHSEDDFDDECAYDEFPEFEINGNIHEETL